MIHMIIAAKNFRRGSEGAAERGFGGNSAAPERRSPAAPPRNFLGGTEQKNILFLFRRKNRARAKLRKRRIFFCEVAAGAIAEAGGGAGHCLSKKVRAKDIISPPNFAFRQNLSRRSLGEGGLSSLNIEFRQNFPRTLERINTKKRGKIQISLRRFRKKFCNSILHSSSRTPATTSHR